MQPRCFEHRAERRSSAPTPLSLHHLRTRAFRLWMDEKFAALLAQSRNRRRRADVVDHRLLVVGELAVGVVDLVELPDRPDEVELALHGETAHALGRFAQHRHAEMLAGYFPLG